MKKILLCFIIIPILYWGISILIGHTDRNGHHFYFYSNWSDDAYSSKEAEEKGILIINKKLHKEILSDSLGILDSVDFWLSKRVIHNKYGFLSLFHFIDTAQGNCDLNSKYLNGPTNLYYKDLADLGNSREGGYEYMNYSTLICKLPKDTIVLEFTKYVDAKHIYKLGKIKLYW